MPPLNAIGIAASDMAESIRFYEAVMPNGVRLMLDSEEVILSFLPDWKRVDGNQVSLAFECESPAEVDEIYARVTEAGFEGEKEPWDAFWGQRYALLGDPDGVRINLYAALPA